MLSHSSYTVKSLYSGIKETKNVHFYSQEKCVESIEELSTINIQRKVYLATFFY